MGIPLRLLILEDRPSDAELVIHELRRSGFDPDWRLVDTEEEYRAHLNENLDVILADFTLPQFDAPYALEVLKEHRLDVPFILVTGSIGEEEAVKCIKQGAADYLLKDRLARLGSAVTHALQERKLRQARRRAEATEKRLNTIIEATSDLISVMDTNGQMVYLNRAGREMLGFAETEVIEGNTITETHPPRVRPLIVNEAIPLAMRNGLWSGETSLLRRDGQEIPVSQVIMAHKAPDSTVEFLSTIARDISERKRVEEALKNYADELEQRVAERTSELRQEKERVEAVLDNSSDAIILADSEGKIQQVNPAFTAMFGYPAEQVVGQSLVTFAQPDHADSLQDMLRRVVDTYQPGRIELPCRRRDGSQFETDMALTSIVEGHQVGSIVCSVRDVTERKMIEQELVRALEKEKELNELKSRFVSMISHEFRTPLAVILASSGILIQYNERLNEEQKKERLQQIQAKVHQLDTLLDTVLSIGRAESVGVDFHPEPVNLKALCESLVDEAQLTTSRHQIHFKCEDEGRAVLVDKKLIQQALVNLLTNAIKYSPGGGPIHFTLSCNHQEVSITVQDEGIGIPQEDQKRMFEMFHRAQNVGVISGTGLGLSIIKQAVEAHNGSISFESQVGAGTTFIIVFPARYPTQG